MVRINYVKDKGRAIELEQRYSTWEDLGKLLPGGAFMFPAQLE